MDTPDISLEIDNIDNFVFNARVAAIIEAGPHVLIARSILDPYFHFPGGRQKVDENSELGVRREVREELGFELASVKPALFAENTFSLDVDGQTKNIREFVLYFRAKVADLDVDGIRPGLVFLGPEGERTQFQWHLKSNLKNIDLRPRAVADLIGEFPERFTYMDVSGSTGCTIVETPGLTRPGGAGPALARPSGLNLPGI